MNPNARPKLVAAWEVLWELSIRSSNRERGGKRAERSLLDALIEAKSAEQLDWIELRFDAVWRKDYESFGESFGECFAVDSKWRIADRVVNGRAAAVAFIKQMLNEVQSILIALGTPIPKVGGGKSR